MQKNDMEKTITFSIHEEDRDRERRQLLRAVYDALTEKGHQPIDQLVGYILTVAVSSCSGAAAVASAFPELAAYKPWIAFVIVCILTWGNLRGMRESAIMFGVPTYFFIFAILALIVTGFVRVLVFG